MKKIIITIAFAATCFPCVLNAQQLQMFTQYMNNNFVINPALAGSETEFAPLRLFVRDQWTGMNLDGNPKTRTLSYHTALLDGKMGIGGYLFNDRFGAVTRTGINASYSYTVKIGETDRLSFGVSGVFYRFHLATDSLIFDAQGNTDPVVYNNAGDFRTYNPNANFGIAYTGKSFWIGIGVPDLIPFKIAANDSFYVVKEVPHIYASLGYKIKLAEDMFLEPSFMIKRVTGAPVQVDFNANLKIKGKFNIGGTFRAGDAVAVMAGYRFKEFYMVGYSYDFVISDLSTYNAGGNHEIMLGINLTKRKKEEGGGDAPKDETPKDNPEEKKDDSKEQK
ncbi:MAG: type IX secretion system membrane protein PorP/SprF [Bacteroidia bacterium]|nr:type IX secretion system membrane protein PorP/SprF [Bacteroidia bacterium]